MLDNYHGQYIFSLSSFEHIFDHEEDGQSIWNAGFAAEKYLEPVPISSVIEVQLYKLPLF